MADISLGAVVGVPVVQLAYTDWTVYSATVLGFGTVASVEAEYMQIGSTFAIRGRFQAGTTSGVTASISLPFTAAGSPNLVNTQVYGQVSNPNGPSGTVGAFSLLVQPSATVANISIGTLTPSLGNGLGVTPGQVVSFNSFFIPSASLSPYLAYGAGLATSVKSGLVSHESDGTFTVYLKPGTGASVASGTAKFHRVGKQVTITLPYLTANNTATTFTLSTSSLANTNSWPSDLIPLRQQRVFTGSQADVAFQMALLQITAAGVVAIFRDTAGNAFQNTAVVKGLPLDDQVITYEV